ncbi:MAG: hypothetical protein AAFR71_16805 [Pseudomonadota bacterium]
MQFEVTNRREEKEGMIFKKTIFKASVAIHLDTDEFEAIKAMAKEKTWRDYPLGTIDFTNKIKHEMTVAGFYEGVKKKGRYESGIRADMPEEREFKINQFQDVARAAKDVIATRLSALSASDEDVSIEI